MRITLNGEAREVAEGTTISALLDQLGIRRDAVAVEVNREVIPRANHGQHTLRAGDVVEIVTFVGGG